MLDHIELIEEDVDQLLKLLTDFRKDLQDMNKELSKGIEQ